MYNHIVGTTQQHFGTTITIPVIGYNVQFVATTTDHVGTYIDPPHQRTIQFVAVDAVVATIGATRVVRCIIVGTAALQDDFHLTVTIQVCHFGIVGNVRGGTLHTIVVINLCQRNVKIA